MMAATAPETPPPTEWIQCSFDVEGRQVNATVRRFNDHERQRIAAEVAWFADGLLGGVLLEGMGWQEFLDRVLSPNVRVTLNDEGLDGATEFWHLLFCRTFEALMVANGLDPMIKARISSRGRRHHDYPA